MRDGEDRPDDQADDDDEEAGVEAEPVEEADTEGVADGAAEDDDRGVVPEERDRREDDPEDEADAPRQDGREEALTEDVCAPLGAGEEAEEECPERQQDREQLQAVEGPGEADADRQQPDDDPFERHERPPTLSTSAAGHRQISPDVARCGLYAPNQAPEGENQPPVTLTLPVR